MVTSSRQAAEVAKLIENYVRTYKVAEVDDRVGPLRQMTNAELMRIIATAGQPAEGALVQLPVPLQQDSKR